MPIKKNELRKTNNTHYDQLSKIARIITDSDLRSRTFCGLCFE